MDEFWGEIRKEFPVFQEYAYLQTQGGGPVPKSLITEMALRLTQLSREGSDICVKWDKEVLEIRNDLARLINCKSSNTAFIPSTSFAMNLLAYSFDNSFKVLTFEDDFPNSYIPWINCHYKVDIIKPESDGSISLHAVEKAVSSKTKILITSHVMYRTGFRQDLIALGNLCRKRGIIFIVDCTQSFGAFDIDVMESHIDVLMFHGYKWINAGFGIGGMYLSDTVLSLSKKPFLGFTSVSKKGGDKLPIEYFVEEKASVFELGRASYLNILMLGFMLKKTLTIGINRIQRRIESLVEYAIKKLKENGIEIIHEFNRKNLSGILALKAYGITKSTLKKEKIIARSDGEILTIAIHYYNQISDIDHLIIAISAHMQTQSWERSQS